MRFLKEGKARSAADAARAPGETAESFRYLDEGRALGKVIMTVDVSQKS